MTVVGGDGGAVSAAATGGEVGGGCDKMGRGGGAATSVATGGGPIFFDVFFWVFNSFIFDFSCYLLRVASTQHTFPRFRAAKPQSVVSKQ